TVSEVETLNELVKKLSSWIIDYGLIHKRNFSWPYSGTATSRVSLQIGSFASFSIRIGYCKYECYVISWSYASIHFCG
ncbi:hypothetical protein IFM89_017018, partial [Coptis chinensis]